MAGRWIEAFNSEVYDGWVNPNVTGNGGTVDANGPRGMLLRSQWRYVQHMQKALTQMNVQLANVIAEVFLKRRRCG